MGDRRPLGRAEDVPEGALREFKVGATSLVVARIGDRFCAVSARCPHMGGPMAKGRLEGGVITCPRHGSRFDMCTGQNQEWVTGAPGLVRGVLTIGRQPRPIATFPVTEEDGTLYVTV